MRSFISLWDLFPTTVSTRSFIFRCFTWLHSKIMKGCREAVLSQPWPNVLTDLWTVSSEPPSRSSADDQRRGSFLSVFQLLPLLPAGILCWDSFMHQRKAWLVWATLKKAALWCHGLRRRFRAALLRSAVSSLHLLLLLLLSSPHFPHPQLVSRPRSRE